MRKVFSVIVAVVIFAVTAIPVAASRFTWVPNGTRCIINTLSSPYMFPGIYQGRTITSYVGTKKISVCASPSYPWQLPIYDVHVTVFPTRHNNNNHQVGD